VRWRCGGMLSAALRTSPTWRPDKTCDSLRDRNLNDINMSLIWYSPHFTLAIHSPDHTAGPHPIPDLGALLLFVSQHWFYLITNFCSTAKHSSRLCKTHSSILAFSLNRLSPKPPRSLLPQFVTYQYVSTVITTAASYSQKAMSTSVNIRSRTELQGKPVFTGQATRSR
jgi:hypothetical protein